MSRQDSIKYRFLSWLLLLSIPVSLPAQKKKGPDDFYLLQLRAAEAYSRHNQVGEAKNILLSVPEAKRTFEWRLLYAGLERTVAILEGHTRPVVGMAVSRDGKYLATGSADSTIIIRNADNYIILRTIRGHKGQVTTLDFSPDGKTLVSGSTDKTLRLWNLDDGSEIRNYNTEFKQGIYQVKFSHDGKMLGVASWEWVNGVQGFAKVLDVQSGKLLQRFNTDNHPAAAVHFSKDDKKLYSGTWGFQVKQHDIAGGSTDWNFDMSKFDYYTAVQSVDLSPDGKYIAEGGKDNKIRLLHAADGKLFYVIEPWQGHREWVNGVCFSPDGNYFASVSDDGLLKVWKTATGENVITWKGHTAGLNQLAWHPDGRRIFTNGNDQTTRVWDITRPGELHFKASVVGPWNAPLSPDGKWIAPVNSDKHFALYDLSSGRQHHFLDSLTAFSAVFSADGKYVAAGNRNINIYNTETGKKVSTGKGHSAVIYGMDFNGYVNLFATAGDNTVRLWNTKDSNAVRTVPVLNTVYTARFSPDGKKIYAGCTNGKVKIIDVTTGRLTDSLQSGTTVFNMAVSASGKYLLTGGNAEAFIWDLAKKKSTALNGHTKWVYGVAIHPSLPVAVTVAYDRTVRFWDLERGINTLTLFGFAHELYTASFTADGNRLLITETDGIVHVYTL